MINPADSCERSDAFRINVEKYRIKYRYMTPGIAFVVDVNEYSTTDKSIRICRCHRWKYERDRGRGAAGMAAFASDVTGQ